MIFVLMNQVQTVLVSSLQPSWHISISLQTKVTYKSQFLVYHFTTYFYLSVFATIFHENLCKSDYGVCDTKHEIVESIFGDDDDSDAVSSLTCYNSWSSTWSSQFLKSLTSVITPAD